MPNYPNASGTSTIPTFPPTSVAKGEQFTFFNAEQPSVPQASDRCALATGPVEGYPQSISVELLFSGAPGAFEVDIQDADTDADIYYQTVPAGGVITTVSSNQTARAELVPIKGRFVRLLLKSRANAVSLTAKVTR